MGGIWQVGRGCGGAWCGHLSTTTKDKPRNGPKQSTMDKYAQPSGAVLTPGPSGHTTMSPDNATLLAAITQSGDMLDSKIGAVGLDVTLLHQNLGKAVDRITEANTRVLGVENMAGILQSKIQKLETMTKELALRVEDA
ncbi:hypothetical protein NDU88_003336 [Pleurodeles waltl]|uniref:Uncharacterized protein n=1 Tax=Pleurodeles waltl TaxID=8319 RepID=A0AAV7NGE0_PLEWA|nr:hypothetical protein NDU88_003336 [Pleurodeles waltl]